MQRRTCGSLGDRDISNSTSLRCSDELTRHAEERIGLGSEADAYRGGIRLIEDLGLPVIHFVLFWYRQIALDAAFGVEELNLGPAFDEAIRDL